MKRLSFAASLCLLGMLMCVSLVARAGAFSPCDHPTVFQDAKVQVFILPYKAESRLTAKGRQLATLVQRHVLFSALKYRSIGVVELTDDIGLCDFGKVASRIHGRLKDDQAAIFLQGRMYEEEDGIRLQSTVEFWPPGRSDVLRWKVGSAGDATMTATLPSGPVMFAPRVIPFHFLEQLEHAQRGSRKLHKSADAASGFRELSSAPGTQYTFQVFDTQGDWMHVRVLPTGEEGWIPAHALATGSDLKGVFPELYFVDGLVGYFELWRGEGADGKLLASTLASLDQYISQASGRAESEARALAAIVKGNAILRAEGDGGWSTETLRAALRAYAQALEIAPTLTAVNTFHLACSAALCGRGACEGDAQRLHAQMLQAVGQDPTSSELVGNLGAFYGAVQGGQFQVDLPASDVSRRRTMLEQAARQATPEH